MATWFIIIIYLSFISLGLPDSLLGAAWPTMWPELGASLGSAGFISMTIAGGTIVSSLVSGKIIKGLGTGKVTLISCCLTAGPLIGISLAPSMIWLIFLAIPLGLGAGSVDAALNHYVAENYEAHHMNWLHCFWGVGATTGPLIMSYFIAKYNSWRGGYAAVGMIQFGLVIILFFTLPLWNRVAAIHEAKKEQKGTDKEADVLPLHGEEQAKGNILKLKGIKNTLITFLFHCGVEATMGLWGASFLVGAKDITAKTAAGWVSLYYGGITFGRLITGFIAMKVPNRVLIRSGQIITVLGGLLLLFPLPIYFTLAGFILIGLGCGPIYPGLLHETPARFGAENSASLMGYQMAVAYTGSTFLPPLFGAVATKTTVSIFPFVVLAYILIMWLNTEKVNHFLKKRGTQG